MNDEVNKMSVTVKEFGSLTNGEVINMYRIENTSGAYAVVTEYGAILLQLVVPDKEGNQTDVVLGYDDVKRYESNSFFFGATIGRNGNRIANGRFRIGSQEVILAQNENENNLHSGPDGMEKKIWKVEEQDENSVTFYRISPDGESGFPGELRISVKYEFTEENELKIYYKGIAEEATVMNFTNHSYFNLNGEGSGTILDHNLKINARYYTPVLDAKSIPTGEYTEVAGTPMDFNSYKAIGKDIEADFDQLKFTGGFDHNYVTDNYAKGNCRKIASVYSDQSGIQMEVSSDLPCVQFYAGNFITPHDGKSGHTYDKRDGFCLETQVEPNAVNVEEFHSPILKAGETFTTVTGYRFYVK